MRRSLLLCLLLVLSVVVTLDAQRTRARRIRAVPATGVSLCGANCFLETTFADALCPAVYVNTGNDASVCQTGDGLTIGGTPCSSGTGADCDKITVDANYAGGRGGKGVRHYRCDGTNCGGGGMRLTFANKSEIWFRFYMRYESGFHWDPSLNYTKDFYINEASSFWYTLGFHGGGFGLSSTYSGGTTFTAVGPPTFATLNGGAGDGDGNFHCYEAHAKMDTDGTDGVAESWVDGGSAISVSNIDYGAGGAAWNDAKVGSNQSTVDNSGAAKYTDYDDIALSTVGRIGCH